MDDKIFMVNIIYQCIRGKYLLDAHEGINKTRPATLTTVHTNNGGDNDISGVVVGVV
jgi:hypothetical protein